MINLTFFTIPHAFENQSDLMQWQAIKSWTLLNPKPDIFLLGNAPGVAAIANELGLYHLPNVDKNASISEIAKWLDRVINNTILVYLNPNVILTEGFTQTIQDVDNAHFLLTGQYRTLQMEGLIDFNDTQWPHQLRITADKQAMPQGQLQNVYLVFTKQLLKDLFVLDPNVEYSFEKQLFYAALRKYYPIIDGSSIITPFLQIPKHYKWKVVDGLVTEDVPQEFILNDDSTDNILRILEENIKFRRKFKEPSKIIVGMASIREREESLKDTIESLYAQVDEIHLYLNNYGRDYEPAFLKREKIKRYHSEDFGDIGDIGKFFMLNKVEGYFFSCDDDIIYPYNYVQKMIFTSKLFNNKAIITNHGVILKNIIKSYYKDRIVFNFWNKTVKNTPVHLGGTGVMCFHTNAIKLNVSDFKRPNMADLYLGIKAQEQCVPIISMKHESNWINKSKKISYENSIWKKSHSKDNIQTELVLYIRSKTGFCENFLLKRTEIAKCKEIQKK